jgi:hypothetical protein
MSESPQPDLTGNPLNAKTRQQRHATGLRLFTKLIIYHVLLAALVVGLAAFFPGFTPELPVGGVTELAEESDEVAEQIATGADPADMAIVETFIRTTNEIDRLGYAQTLTITLVGVWLLMLPVAWVHRGIHPVNSLDHSLDETVLILPGVVAAIVLVVQHSLALAFSLAGIVAGVQFRRALQETYDALFILVAIGTGIAAGVKALEIALVLTVFFSYATLYVYTFGDGFESDYMERNKLLKHMEKEAIAIAAAQAVGPSANQSGITGSKPDPL